VTEEVKMYRVSRKSLSQGSKVRYCDCCYFCSLVCVTGKEGDYRSSCFCQLCCPHWHILLVFGYQHVM